MTVVLIPTECSEEMDPLLPRRGEEITTFNKTVYKICGILGKGGYGAVFESRRSTDNERLAIKCETLTAKKKVILLEKKVMLDAREHQMSRVCSLVDAGVVENHFSFVVMNVLGKNLWEVRVERGCHRFSLSTALQMAEQTLLAIEQLHRLGYLHRDVKPGNFALGPPSRPHNVHIIDFGLSRCYTWGERELRPQRERASYRGTTRYASLAALTEKDQSRKDDLESWLYVVMEWTSGGLPWKREKGKDKAKVEAQKKELRTNETLLNQAMKGCPKETYVRIMRYLDDLEYYDVPDYTYIFGTIRDTFMINHLDPFAPLDWETGRKFQPSAECIGDGIPPFTKADFQRQCEDQTQQDHNNNE